MSSALYTGSEDVYKSAHMLLEVLKRFADDLNMYNKRAGSITWAEETRNEMVDLLVYQREQEFGPMKTALVAACELH